MSHAATHVHSANAAYYTHINIVCGSAYFYPPSSPLTSSLLRLQVHWLQDQFIHPLAEWWIDTVLGTWEQSMKSIVRESFAKTTRAINGFCSFAVAILPVNRSHHKCAFHLCTATRTTGSKSYMTSLSLVSCQINRIVWNATHTDGAMCR